MKKALIIFVRPPEWGKVKTRLAAQIGNDAALLIYKKLLAHTKSIALGTNADVFVFATEKLNDDYWKEFSISVQKGATLGDKMLDAFETVLNKGYHKIVIIGSDCPELTVAQVEQAFDKLATHDMVIGPAKDGGYYLLGMKKLFASVFFNKAWSTASVFADTVNDIKNSGLSFAQLPLLTDVDTEENWLLVKQLLHESDF